MPTEETRQDDHTAWIIRTRRNMARMGFDPDGNRNRSLAPGSLADLKSGKNHGHGKGAQQLRKFSRMGGNAQ